MDGIAPNPTDFNHGTTRTLRLTLTSASSAHRSDLGGGDLNLARGVVE